MNKLDLTRARAVVLLMALICFSGFELRSSQSVPPSTAVLPSMTTMDFDFPNNPWDFTVIDLQVEVIGDDAYVSGELVIDGRRIVYVMDFCEVEWVYDPTDWPHPGGHINIEVEGEMLSIHFFADGFAGIAYGRHGFYWGSWR